MTQMSLVLKAPSQIGSGSRLQAKPLRFSIRAKLILWSVGVLSSTTLPPVLVYWFFRATGTI